MKKEPRFKFIREVHWDMWAINIMCGKGQRTSLVYHDELDDDYAGVWRDRTSVPVMLIGITIGPFSFGVDWKTW